MPRPDVTLFLASAVHDMKNSISVMSDFLRRYIAKHANDEDHDDLEKMAQTLYETQRINGNLIQLLTLYKLGADRYPFAPETQDMNEFADIVVSHLEPLLDSRNIALEIDVEDDCYWDFDQDLVMGVVIQALNNAVHYTKDTVALRIATVDKTLEIRVEDNGKGFPGSMINDGSAAMQGSNFNTGSTGLGLYFAAVVARLHRNHGKAGSIRLENHCPLGGGVFILHLP